MNFLIDHNLKGQAVLIWGIIAAEGWLDLVSIRFITFEEVGMPIDSSDCAVWQFAQDNQMILITANRNMKGTDSLEQTIREENTADSLPIVTIGNLDRLDERNYRERCAARLIEIVLDIENYMGVGRLFIP
jgi:predicted nuclease of predicted toxin-antitoxin system